MMPNILLRRQFGEPVLGHVVRVQPWGALVLNPRVEWYQANGGEGHPFGGFGQEDRFAVDRPLYQRLRAAYDQHQAEDSDASFDRLWDLWATATPWSGLA